MRDVPYSRTALLRGAWKFLTGKVISALLTFGILLWLVRLMPVAEYGAYLILVAGMELGVALSGLGLPWLAARYLPEYRLHASGAKLIAICRQLFIWQVLSLLVFVSFFAILLDSYLAWMELKFLLFPAQAYLAVLLVEGLSRFIRVTLMDPLMLQEQARFSTVLRQFSFLALIVILDFARQGTLLWIVWAELAASTLGMIAAGTLLWRQLYELHGRIGQSGWSAPALSAQWHIAGRMYVTHLLTLVYSPQVIIILIQRTMGVESSALFGFLSNLQRQIANYLPATLLFSLIRTKMVADYVGGGGMAELSRNANLAGKLSLFALMPLVTLTALAGDPTVAWLSGNKFTDSGLLLFGLMLALVPYSQWQLNQSVAVVVGHADLCILAAASGLVVFPLMWIMLQLGLGLWSAIIAIGLGYMILNIILVTGVSRWADYRADWMGFFKLLFSALVACSISMLLHMEDLEVWISTWLLVVLQSLLAILIYFVLAWWIKPFAAEERNRINALAKRRVFFW